MQFVKGMRDRIQKYFDETKVFTVEMEVLGNATYDCCCFGVDDKGKLSDEKYMIFYNQTTSPNHEINYMESGHKSIFEIGRAHV